MNPCRILLPALLVLSAGCEQSPSEPGVEGSIREDEAVSGTDGGGTPKTSSPMCATPLQDELAKLRVRWA